MSLPRDLGRRHPRPRAPEAQRRLRLRRGPPDAAHRPQPAEDPDQPHVNVNFWGFRGAVDRLGCVYVDVDHRYFNDNSPPNGGGGPYAAIDVSAGYQRLCGQDALDYVRYRHLDNDLIRAARQQ